MGDSTLIAAAIGVGGTVIVGVAGFWANVRNTNKTTALTLRAVELTEQGQVTERYSKAVEQLGSNMLDVRIGGIYALERIAHDSPRDQPTIMEVLAAFVREHSTEPWPPSNDNAPGADTRRRKIRPDVQAAVRVIGRRNPRHDPQTVTIEREGHTLIARPGADLRSAYLAYADLVAADLTVAALTGADLTGARLLGANLADANLTNATLTNALLVTAVLTGTHLTDADLTGADLMGANLTGANLTGVTLTGANLRSANLTDANLTNATLTDAILGLANLTGVTLTGATLTGAALYGAEWRHSAKVPEGWQKLTGSDHLVQSESKSGTAAAE